MGIIEKIIEKISQKHNRKKNNMQAVYTVGVMTVI